MKNKEMPKKQQNAALSKDEKIVNRTNMRRRKNKRKKLIIRTVLGGTFLVAGLVVAMLLFFNINKISVTGDSVYSSEEVIRVSEIQIGDNLIFLSKNRINKLVTEKLPYVGSVKLKRRLPAHLEIQVTKTDAVFGIAQDGFYALLDRDGKVLETNVEYIGTDKTLLNAGKVVSAVVGEKIVLENEKTFPRIKEVYETCENVGLTDITEINITELHNIKVVYQGRITLELGKTDGDRLSKKLAFGKAAIDKQNVEDNQFRGTINLTVDKKGYLQEETTEPETEPTTEPVSEGVSTPATDEKVTEPTSNAA
ncbi:MAG: FtsQ-type POTRA domain-containing protein [Clostridia bacterium]|nr:FtsQ-type POTRA domain-containing protein [Clostridia bacterium]